MAYGGRSPPLQQYLPDDFTKFGGVLTQPIDSLSKLSMTWEASYGAYYYEYCVDTTAQCIAPELWHNVGLATTATASDLLLDTTYYWQVRAVNYLGETINYTYADTGTWWEVETRTFGKIRPVDLAVHYVQPCPWTWESPPSQPAINTASTPQMMLYATPPGKALGCPLQWLQRSC